MKTETMIDKLKCKVLDGVATANIIAENGNDKYEINITSAIIDPSDGHYNAVATIHANGQYFMTKPFIDIVKVLEQMEIQSVY